MFLVILLVLMLINSGLSIALLAKVNKSKDNYAYTTSSKVTPITTSNSSPQTY